MPFNPRTKGTHVTIHRKWNGERRSLSLAWVYWEPGHVNRRLEVADVDETLRDFIMAKLAEWGPDPVMTILQRGEQSLTVELSSDSRLDAVCGWFAKPADEVLVGAVEGLLQSVNGLVGLAGGYLTHALISACAQRHRLNRQAAQTNIAVGGIFAALLAVVVATVARDQSASDGRGVR